MAQVSKLAEVLNGLVQNIDLTASDLITNSVWVGGTNSSPSIQVTPTLLNSFLTSITAGSGISVTGSAPSQTVAVDNSVVRTNGVNAFTADQSMGGNKLISVADPTLAQDAATKNYVDTAIQNTSAVEITFTSGVSLTANTSYLVRMALSGETAGDVYLADASSAVANGKFWAIGLASGGASGVSISGSVKVQLLGSWTLGSSDTPFIAGDVGKPVWLSTSGTFVTTAPSTSGYADFKIGMVQSTTQILIDSKQLTGIA